MQVLRFLLCIIAGISILTGFNNINAVCAFEQNNSCISCINSKIKHIRNFAKVDNCYYRGGRLTDEDILTLHQIGVKTIINLREPYRKADIIRQKRIANGFGMNYCNIPLIQSIPPTEDEINQFFSILNNPDNLPVYVHCNAGKDRTGIMTALYRVKYYNWNFEQAYKEMKFYGFHRVLFPEQKYFLKEYINLYA